MSSVEPVISTDQPIDPGPITVVDPVVTPVSEPDPPQPVPVIPESVPVVPEPPAVVSTTPDLPPEKPWYTRTELWLTVVNTLIQVAIAILAFKHPGYSLPAKYQGLVDTFVPMVASAMAALGVGIYSHGRAKVKVARVQAVGALRTAAVYASDLKA